MSIERKYAFTRLAQGDYLFPSNDGRTLWRVRRYVEGPSAGLDWPRDKMVWGVWKWLERIDLKGSSYIDPDDDSRWEFTEGFHDTRKESIARALEIKGY